MIRALLQLMLRVDQMYQRIYNPILVRKMQEYYHQNNSRNLYEIDFGRHALLFCIACFAILAVSTGLTFYSFWVIKWTGNLSIGSVAKFILSMGLITPLAINLLKPFFKGVREFHHSIFALLHISLRGRAEREIYIHHYLDFVMPTRRAPASRPQAPDPYFLEDFLKKTLEEFKDLPKFVETHFTKSSSLIKFIGERSKNASGQVEPYFVLFLLSIPKRKTLSIDQLKAIINCGMFCETSVKVFQKEYFLNGQKISLLHYLNNPEFVAERFFNYSEDQITSLLTRRYLASQYVSLLEAVVIEKKETDSSHKFIIQILENTSKKINNPALHEINQKEESGYRIVVLQTKKDYDEAKKDFHNCVSTYFTQSNLDIVTLYYKNKPVICAAFGSHLVTSQIKAPFNEVPGREHQAYLMGKISDIKHL